MRLFIAVDVSEEIRTAVMAVESRLRPANADVGWVKPENFHLTLKFLGETPEGQLPDIKASLDLIGHTHTPFETELRGIGCFPERGLPRVVWIGVGLGREKLITLAGEFETSMQLLGVPREFRGFAAHLTIGRVRGPRGAERLRRLAESESGLSFGRCRIDRVRLYKSTLAPGGSIYEVLHTAVLGEKGEG